MNEPRKLSKLLLYVTLALPTYALGTQRSLSYDEAWIEGKFDAKSLSNVWQLYPEEGTSLNEDRQEALAQSRHLHRLKTLNLRCQNIDDKFIQRISSNQTFSRIINLNLSYNHQITDKSLEYILDSDYLGSIRDLPQISGHYGLPSSEIYITTEGTGITTESVKKYQNNPRFNFCIDYINPVTDKRSAASNQGAIKWLQFN